MFDVLVNLILTSLFLQAQAGSQTTLENLSRAEYRLPEAELRKLQMTAPQKAETNSLGVAVTAQSVLVTDEDTGKILSEKNSGEIRSIASITKLMAALVFLDNNPGWDKEIIIQTSDYREGGIRYLIAGESISSRDLFSATLIASSNEAAIALARATGLSEEEFVSRMNQKATDLGMKNSRFADPAGLNNGNESTALDITLLLNRALADVEIFNAVSGREYQITILNKGIARQLKSTDKILGQSFGVGENIFRVEAGKTGYLEKAGYCFASRVSDQFGRKILVVVLGSSTIDNRFIDTKSLAYWVFNNYIWR